MLIYVSSDIIIRFRQSYQNNYLGKCTVTVHCEIFCRDAQLYIVHGFDFNIFMRSLEGNKYCCTQQKVCISDCQSNFKLRFNLNSRSLDKTPAKQ